MAKRKRTRGMNYPLENLFGHILSPFERFLQRTTSGGIILMGTTVVALVLANTPWRLCPSSLGAASASRYWLLATETQSAFLDQ